MNIQFSRHARRQMKWRMITEEDVEMVISNPDRLEDTLDERTNAFKRFGDRCLKVTYKHENECIVIITAMVKGGP